MDYSKMADIFFAGAWSSDLFPAKINEANAITLTSEPKRPWWGQHVYNKIQSS